MMVPVDSADRKTSRTYHFGRNWQDYLTHHADDASLAVARTSLESFLPHPLEGRTFLDAGCGSGVFSLAAFRAGAASVTSFDADPDSVACCRKLWEGAGCPAHWTVLQGSLLDKSFLGGLPRADVVYCWGVAHHTGSMWEAIDNLLDLASPGGLLYLAIYNRVTGLRFHSDGRFGSSAFWLWEKRLYVSLPKFLQRLTDILAASLVTFLYLLTFRNPLKEYASHHTKRGMSFMTNLRDWLGGYPYEFASVDEIRSRITSKPGWELLKHVEWGGLLNNEFLFRKPSGPHSAVAVRAPGC